MGALSILEEICARTHSLELIVGDQDLSLGDNRIECPVCHSKHNFWVETDWDRSKSILVHQILDTPRVRDWFYIYTAGHRHCCIQAAKNYYSNRGCRYILMDRHRAEELWDCKRHKWVIKGEMVT